jgi:hypothetical protein
MKRPFAPCLLIAAGLIFLTLRLAAQPVIINEILHQPAAGRMEESYIELYNNGTGAVSLAGWHFSDGINFTFGSGAAIPAGSYLVVAANASGFTNRYPDVKNFVAGWTPPMDSHLVLRNAQGQVVSEVRFATEGEWATRILTNTSFASYGHYGWLWDAPHNGRGPSLELVNPALGIAPAQNWASSPVLGGTPGRPNSAATNNGPPIILGVAHSPVIPKPAEPVTITARLVDESLVGVNALVYYRVASTPTPGPLSPTSMLDDGMHNDGLANDGLFGAMLPAQPLGTVVEFYLEARDAAGNTRIYPSVRPPLNSLRTANLLYQVDDENYAGSQPIYRIIMTEMERAELYAIGRNCPDSDSDAQMNATWITIEPGASDASGIQLRYNASARNRGHVRGGPIPTIITSTSPMTGNGSAGGINLNVHYAHSTVLGSAIFRALGVPMPCHGLCKCVNGRT